MKRQTLTVTTDTGGDGTATGEGVSGGGAVYAIDYLPGTLDTGATVTLSDEFNGVSYTIWSLATAGTSNLRVNPRQLDVKGSDGSALTTVSPSVVTGTLKLTVASGGAAKTGSVVVHIVDV